MKMKKKEREEREGKICWGYLLVVVVVEEQKAKWARVQARAGLLRTVLLSPAHSYGGICESLQ